MDRKEQEPPAAAARLSVLGMLIVFAGLCAPLLFTDGSGPYTWDEDQYHLPAVRQIAAHWPRIDVQRDSLSATAPGYHYVLATVAQLTGTSRTALRIVNFGFSAAVLVLLWRAFPKKSAASSVLAVAPLATSNFFVKSSCWVVTDNPALLAAAGSLVLLFASPPTVTSQWSSAAAAALSTTIRQMNVWLAGPLFVRAWMDARALTRPMRRVVLACSVAFPCLVLAYLVWQWGGLVPPAWADVHRGGGRITLAGLTYILVVLASFAPFYLVSIRDTGTRVHWLRDRRTWIAFGCGVLCALASPTTYDEEGNRWGGYWWNATVFFPAPLDRSVLLTFLAGVGAAAGLNVVQRLYAAAGARTTLLWLAALACWLVSSCANLRVFHRYFEPPILVFLALWAVLMIRSRPLAHARAVPLMCLSLVQILITIGTAHVGTLTRRQVATPAAAVIISSINCP